MDLVKRVGALLLRCVHGERRMLGWLWGSLLCNMGIVVTGALVRLTGSGLGCSVWPRCTPQSWIATPESGIHGAIEFGNRLLTFVLLVAAVGAFAAAWVNRGPRTALWRITLAVGAGIVAQAVVGGITVRTELHPFAVAPHLLISVVLIVLCVWSLCIGRRAPRVGLPATARYVVIAAFLTTMLTVWTGTITTGSGPHAGDADAPRTGFDLELVTRLHAISAWPVVLLAATCVVLSWRHTRSALVFLAAVLAQGAIGYAQYFLGLPVALVTLHMVGLTVITAAVAWLFFTTRRCHASHSDSHHRSAVSPT